MKISELIEELKELMEDEGDIPVVVQYRDEGGSYYGEDEELYLIVRKDADVGPVVVL